MVGIVVVTRAAVLIARRASAWTVDEHLSVFDEGRIQHRPDRCARWRYGPGLARTVISAGYQRGKFSDELIPICISNRTGKRL